MNEHPIEGLMTTAMNSIKDMVDVNTIIGEPIETSNNIIIIPISKVGFGFASGGSEFKGETINEYMKKEKEEQIQYRLPFGRGSGAGVSITPVAFLVVQANNVKLLPVNHSCAMDRLMDYVPDLMEKVNSLLNKQMSNKKEEKKDGLKQKVKELKEEKEKLEQQNAEIKIESPIIQNKARPKRNKPIPAYEYEYDETEMQTPQTDDYDDE